MKNLFKTLVICGLFALVGSMTTSCVQDPNETWGAPEFAITGKPTVNNAISVDVPVNAKYLKKLAYMVEEYVITADGKRMTIKGYDAEKKPIYNHLVDEAPKIAQIFRAQRNGNGKLYENVRGLTSLHISGNEGLDKSKKFVVYFAAAISETEYYNNGQIYSVEFETPEKYSDDDVVVLRENFEGMDVAVTIPPSVKKAIAEKNSRATWGVTNIAVEAYNGPGTGKAYQPACASLYHNHYVYPAFFFNRDTVLNINHYNAYRRNEKGEIGWYITTGEAAPEESTEGADAADTIMYYYLFTPGEPLVLTLAEVHECTKENGLLPTMGFYIDSDGCGWYSFPYDMQAYYNAVESNKSFDPNDFWYSDAWHRRIELTLPGPAKFDGTVNVEISDLSANSGKITFTPDDRTFMYLFGVFPETDAWGSGYKDITNMFLKGKEDLWQWFLTSQTMSELGIGDYKYASEGVQELVLEKYFTSLIAGGTYHLVVNAVGAKMNDDGDLEPDMSAQNFQHITFQLKNYSLEEPEIVVTAVEPYSPWKVKFNVKNPNWNNPKYGEVEKVAFVANFTRDFDSFMKAYDYTYTDMVMMNASSPRYLLSDTDIAKVNSDSGADIEFDVFENSAFTCAMMAWNKEGRASNPDKVGAQAHAEAFSISVEPATPLPGMATLNALKGEWTATATVNVYDANTDTFTKTERSWSVTIGDVNESETLSDADYAFLETNGVTKEAADAYLAQYNAQAKKYNEGVVGQNRVLCLGWSVDDDRTMAKTSPWGLFMMEDYNASIVDYLFYDFGPKWFLQVNENGQVFVPVHYNRVPPMCCWCNGMNHYLCGANYEAKIANYINPDYPDNVEAAGLPVVVSEDGNTVTINGYTINYYSVDENDEPIKDDNGEIIYTPVDFYPNVVYDYYGTLQFYNSHIVSSVKLTKGAPATTPEVTPTPSKMSAKVNAILRAAKSVNGATYTTPSRPYAKTTLVPQAKKESQKVTTIDKKYPTREEIDQRMQAHLRKIGMAPRN